jgi:hypothetical protein
MELEIPQSTASYFFASSAFFSSRSIGIGTSRDAAFDFSKLSALPPLHQKKGSRKATKTAKKNIYFSVHRSPFTVHRSPFTQKVPHAEAQRCRDLFSSPKP